MKSELIHALRCGALAFFLVASAQTANAQSANARGIVVDSNGKIYQANYLCDIAPDCSRPLVNISRKKVKKGSAVAIGTITPARPENYVFIGNGGKKGEILLLVEPSPGATTWTDTAFDGTDGATAMVVTRNIGTLYAARDGGTIDIFRRNGGGPAGYDDDADGSFSVSYPGGGACSEIVGIEEYPRNTGNLLVACNAPTGLIQVNNPDGPGAPTFAPVIPANSIGSSLAAVGVSTVPVVNGGLPGARDYALVVAKPSEVLAIDLGTAAVQRNVLNGSGQVRDLATGLCFRDPNNEADGDEDVDETCFATVQSGRGGRTTYVELAQSAPGSSMLSANVVDAINNPLKNSYGVDLINTGTEEAGNCLDGCQIANNIVTNALVDVPGNEIISFETQGSFTDPRFDPVSGMCDRVELPLDFTGIPVLKDAVIGPEFCARNGTFFVDVLSAPGVTPTSGFTKYETPGECWMPGFNSSLTTMPETTLDGVEYGLLFGDQFDLLRIDGTNDPIDSPSESYDDDYITNRFAQDNLVGCTNPRVRAGGRFTFIIEDFVGADLMGDLGSINSPIGNNILFRYGSREAIQRIEIPVLSPQSGCFDGFGGGSPASACVGHVEAMNAGLAGWNLQRLVGEDDLITGDELWPGIDGDAAATVSLSSGLNGLDLNILASDGDVFKFKTVNFPGSGGTKRVLGLDSPVSGEIAIGQSITFEVIDTPLAGEADLVAALTGNAMLDVNVPFRVPRVTMALQFDGPEFGDVQEAVEFRATLDDGTIWTGKVTNIYEANSDPDVFGWEAMSDNPARPVPGGMPSITVLSGDNSSAEDAVFTVDSPFGDVSIVSFEVAAVTGESADVCGGSGTGNCGNQSEASIYDIGIEAVDRVQALSFAYTNYLRALCTVSSRPDFGTVSDESRPQICNVESIASQTAEFNEIAGSGGVVVERNIAGYQQADLEGVLRFISHNICELDFGTDANPGGVALATGGFCETVPEWAPTPGAP